MRAELLLPLLLAACGDGAVRELDLARARAELARRDVLLVTLDTTRADHLGCYGYPRATTPFLDGLAAEGVRFERAVAAAPLTLVSHASLLTGLDPPRHGVHNNGYYALGEGPATLAELLARAGRRTAAFVSAPVLAREQGLGRGFERYDDDVPRALAPTRFNIATRPAERSAELALEWLTGLERGERAFLWLHLFDPHAPYLPPPRYRALFGTEAADLYDAELRAVDDALAGLAEGLRAAGRDALWVVTADHGEALGEHGEPTHGILLHGATLSVPLILSARGALPPAVVGALARHVDVLPTLLDLLDVAAPAGLDGRSLLPAIAGEDLDDAAAYSETFHPWEAWGWSPLRALTAGDARYVQAPRPELYDLAEDPRELRDVAAERPERARELRERLAALAARAPAGDAGDAARRSPGAAERAELAALGYAASEPPPPPAADAVLADPKDLVGMARPMDMAETAFAAGAPLHGLRFLEEALAIDPENPFLLRLGALEPLRALQLDRDPRTGEPAAARPAPPEDQVAALLGAARELGERWLAVRPDEPDARYARGLLLELEGDVAGARAAYRAVAAEHADHALSRSALLELALAEGDAAAARRAADEVLRCEPADRPARHAAARLALEAGELAAALPHYEALVDGADGPERDLVLLRLGQCRQGLGRHAQALDAFDAVEDPALRAFGRVDELAAASRRALGRD